MRPPKIPAAAREAAKVGGRVRSLERRVETRGLGGEYAWMHKEAVWTLPSSSLGMYAAAYDLSGGDFGTAFSLDLARGRINILETGVYLFQVGAFVNLGQPMRAWINLQASDFFPRLPGNFIGPDISATWPNEEDMSATALVIITELFDPPYSVPGITDNYISGAVAQVSGVNRTVARFSLSAQKLRNLSELQRSVAARVDLPRTMVWGGVYNDGSIILGAGFTVQNDYGDGINFTKITFTTPFANPPVVALAANNNNPVAVAGRYVVSLTTRTASYIIVRQDDIDDADFIGNGGFDFVCAERLT